ncbi:hypothetical protein M9979_00950 [Sphingomonas sp. RP10(2022)]|uniref:Uncharacterized protein n=1 Tax=Sphingomonas liriopis TaxID=2949094 RepID=A0A9X2KS51_9SPHN|nr:hypothetical protein [Sphingomonas liriopis]MCP3733453.1 hypothetical protein [Sphingomonas liriopis]
MTRPTDPLPPVRSPLAKTGGCLLSALLLWVELTIGIAIAALVAEPLGPPLAARGYDPDIGTGFLIAWGLGAAIAVYPVIWLDRLRRRWTR